MHKIPGGWTNGTLTLIFPPFGNLVFIWYRLQILNNVSIVNDGRAFSQVLWGHRKILLLAR
jgi:hypothetical protein